MIEGVEVVCFHLREQIHERGGVVDPAAQHQGVDEHADEIVQCRVAAPCHRSGDRDVVGTAQARQHHRERGVQHHEHTDVLLAGDLDECPMDLGVDGEANPATPEILRGGPRAIGGQRQQIG